MYLIYNFMLLVFFFFFRYGLLGPGSSETLLGPKDSQRGSASLLDAKELLKHFTSDGRPTGDLQSLTINRE